MTLHPPGSPLRLKNGIIENGVVITPDFQIGRVKKITEVPGEIHANSGNVEVEIIAGPLKGTTRHMFGGYLQPLNQDTYRAHTKLLKERQGIFDEGMAALHHDTRFDYGQTPDIRSKK